MYSSGTPTWAPDETVPKHCIKIVAVDESGTSLSGVDVGDWLLLWDKDRHPSNQYIAQARGKTISFPQNVDGIIKFLGVGTVLSTDENGAVLIPSSSLVFSMESHWPSGTSFPVALVDAQKMLGAFVFPAIEHFGHKAFAKLTSLCHVQVDVKYRQTVDLTSEHKVKAGIFYQDRPVLEYICNPTSLNFFLPPGNFTLMIKSNLYSGKTDKADVSERTQTFILYSGRIAKFTVPEKTEKVKLELIFDDLHPIQLDRSEVRESVERLLSDLGKEPK
jgi:hypothetical protein